MENYIRDGRGSTIIVEEGLAQDMSSYQMEMLRKNKPVGLLPVQVCAINGQKEYHYDGGSRVPLSEYLDKRTIGKGLLEQFIDSIKSVIFSVEEYLLELNCLCMEPEHIYIDEKENNALQFCYGPFLCIGFEKGLLKLLQYFLEKLDYDDKQGVTMAYQMYQNVVREGYTSVFTYKIIEQQPEEQKIVFPWEEDEKGTEPCCREEQGNQEEKNVKIHIPMQIGVYAAGIMVCGAAAGLCYWQKSPAICGGAVLAAAGILYALIQYGRRYKGIDSTQNTW